MNAGESATNSPNFSISRWNCPTHENDLIARRVPLTWTNGSQ